MHIFIAADHAGFTLKNALAEHIRTLGYEVEDVGAFTLEPEDDYPDFVTPLAKRVAEENARVADSARGIVIGGSGQGEAMAANRVKGVRAAVFYVPPAHVGRGTSYMGNGGNEGGNGDIVRLAREHNNANILSIGARFVSGVEADEAVRIFLETPFSNSPRHVRRLAKF